MRWNEYPLVARRLVLARGFRSFGQGMLIVNFALYLKALGWSATHIGILLTASGLAGAVFSLGVGFYSDRIGRKPFILGYETLTVLGGLFILFSANAVVLSFAAIAASFGRGQNGGAGPFGPAEQAWLAHSVPLRQRGSLFSLNAAVGFSGMGIGAILAGTVVLIQHWLPGPVAYRPLFLLVVGGSIANLLMLWSLPDPRMGAPASPPPNVAAQVVSRENRDILRLMLTNAVNGLAIGLTGPLIAYWFAVRFGVSPAEIGGMMGISLLAVAGSNLMTGWMSQRMGVVRIVVFLGVMAFVSMALIPLMPSFFWAAVLYFLRSMTNRGSVGARQAIALSLTRDQRRGKAASMNMVSVQIPASVGPTIAGILIQEGSLSLPFFFSSGLQLGYTLLFGRFFHRFDQEMLAPPTDPTSLKSL